MMEIKKLKYLYAGSIFILAFFAILTPLFITDGFSIIDEELLETIIIAFLFTIGFILNRIYEKELRLNKKQLTQAWMHVGENNVLTESFQKSLLNINRFPDNKKDLNLLLNDISQKILAMINCQFISFRIIKPKEIKTLCEYSQARNPYENPEIKISSKQLLNNEKSDNYEIITSSITNPNIMVYCIISKIKINKYQKIFIQKIINDLTMIYLIYKSGLNRQST